MKRVGALVWGGNYCKVACSNLTKPALLLARAMRFSGIFSLTAELLHKASGTENFKAVIKTSCGMCHRHGIQQGFSMSA